MTNPPSGQSPATRPADDAPPKPKAKTFVWWFSRLIPIALFFGAGLLLIAILGLAQRIGWLQATGPMGAPAAVSVAEEVYTCPMHPQIRQPQPGRCPICGMPLVPATSGGADLDLFAIQIDPAQRRLANIQTAAVKQEPVSTSLETIGAIQIDESRQATIAAYIDGRLERLFADYTGVEVKQGDHLAVVYSPELFAAQVEYAETRKALAKMTGGALASVRQVQEKLVQNSRQKLVELGVTDEQITELERTGVPKSRLTIYAPMGGTVTEKLAEEGKYISAGEPIYRIANLSTVWLMLELYPEDAARIRFGQTVDAELQSLPGEHLTGRVAFIDPTVNNARRTVGVRVELKNVAGRLRPGDYAKATIEIPIGPQGNVYDEELAGKWISPMHPQIIRDKPGDCPICGMKLVSTSRYGYSETQVAQPASLVVPRSAVLMAGDYSVVYVETEPGRFELRNVTLGPILRDRAVVLSGVEVGEMVATSGNFLIDSQMQLAGKPSLIDPKRHVFRKENGGHQDTPAIDPEPIAGETGKRIELLYQAYFDVQHDFADDQVPSAQHAQQLSELAKQSSAASEITQPYREMLKQAAADAEHLHHLTLAEGRKKFTSISHAIVETAKKYRGANATAAFRHFFCPMVEQRAGDWLQVDAAAINPYMGKKMLRCGELIQTISPAAPDIRNDNEPQHDPNHAPQRREGE